MGGASLAPHAAAASAAGLRFFRLRRHQRARKHHVLVRRAGGGVEEKPPRMMLQTEGRRGEVVNVVARASPEDRAQVRGRALHRHVLVAPQLCSPIHPRPRNRNNREHLTASILPSKYNLCTPSIQKTLTNAATTTTTSSASSSSSSFSSRSSERHHRGAHKNHGESGVPRRLRR